MASPPSKRSRLDPPLTASAQPIHDAVGNLPVPSNGVDDSEDVDQLDDEADSPLKRQHQQLHRNNNCRALISRDLTRLEFHTCKALDEGDQSLYFLPDFDPQASLWACLEDVFSGNPTVGLESIKVYLDRYVVLYYPQPARLFFFMACHWI